jgi:hypothetical protein
LKAVLDKTPASGYNTLDRAASAAFGEVLQLTDAETKLEAKG